MKRAIFITLSLCFSLFTMKGQQSYFYKEKGLYEDYIEEWQRHKLYGVVLNRTESFFTDYFDPIEYALSSDYKNESRSLDLLLEQSLFTTDVQKRSQINALIAINYFDQSRYEQTLEFADKSESIYLSEELKEELDFKTAYSSFINQDFDLASLLFKKPKSNYVESSIYYAAMADYFLDDLDLAIEGFKKVDNVYPYDDYVPYYLTQIYFANKDFSNTVSYGTQALRNNQLENKFEIHKLVGLASFELGDYDTANENLAIYAEQSPKLTKEEFYQIAYSQYKLSKYETSISNFKEISNLQDTLGTLANFYIADAYLKMGDKSAAQTGFGKLAKMSIFKDLQEDAQFNYAVLSSELGDERLAINSLTAIHSGHKHFDKSQQLLSQILRNSKDYVAAMAVIDDMPVKSDGLNKIYQELAYKKALQDFNDQTPLSSLTFFAKAEQTPGNKKLKAESIFWQSYIHQQSDNKIRSQSFLDQYFNYVKLENEAKDPSIYARANYMQAYKYWVKGEYKQAKPFFKASIKESALSNQKTADVQTRLGDVHLVDNQYNLATDHYESALRLDPKADYPAFQLGIVAGLNKSPVDKIVLLEEFESNFPKSDYRDDALFEIGNAYFEVGKRNDALRAFDQLIVDFGLESPLARKTLLKRGLISYNAGDNDAAIQSYREIFALNPSADEKREALSALEEIYLNELNDPKTYFEIAESEAGVKINSLAKDSLSYSIALDQFKNGEYDRAANNFATYVDDYPTGLNVLPAIYYQGESFSLLKDYEKALGFYQQVLSKGKNDYYLKALKKAALISYNHQQDYAQSFKYYDELVQKEGINDKLFLEAALVSANLNVDQDAVILYANKLVAHPDAQLDQKATAYFYLGKASESKSMVDEAIVAYNKVVQLSKNNKAAEASYLLAKIFFNRNDMASAERQGLETTKRSVNYPLWVAKSLLLLTDVYMQNKDVYNAKAAIEAVIENYNDDPNIIDEANQKKVMVDQLEVEENRVKPSVEEGQFEMDTLKTDK